MFDRIRAWGLSSPGTIGVLLVTTGLVLFLVVFFAVFPVLSDPVGTYDRWFPDAEEPAAEPAAVIEEEAPTGPTAVFRFVAETVGTDGGDGEEGDPEAEYPEAEYRVSFEDRSELGDAEITRRTWDLGDGSAGRRPSFDHVYPGPGSYPVRLEIEDANGMTSAVEGDIEVPDEGRSSGRIAAEEDLDLSGIEAAVEDAVVTLEGSVEDTLDSFATASRSFVVVILFALAAIASTIVAWRVTRAGVLLLRPAEKMRLKVKSADMHLDMGGAPPEDQVAAAPEAETPTADETTPELIEV